MAKMVGKNYASFVFIVQVFKFCSRDYSVAAECLYSFSSISNSIFSYGALAEIFFQVKWDDRP